MRSEVPQVVREVGMFAVILKAVPNYDKHYIVKRKRNGLARTSEEWAWLVGWVLTS